ncbi:MAG: gamma-glutamyltransferase, partial [Pseudomonadota bacterium]
QRMQERSNLINLNSVIPTETVEDIEDGIMQAAARTDCDASYQGSKEDWTLYPPLSCVGEGSARYFAPKDLKAADAKLEDGDTTYLTVTDKDGMMVSLIQSNYRGMGSGLVPDGLGFMLQDRGQLFSLDPDHPNVFEPGKRPFHTIIPAFAYKNVEGSYEPWLSFGLMGGGMQPQGHVQIILNLVDFDMGLQEAGDAARWEHRGGCEPTDNLEGDECGSDLGTIWLESGIPEETRAELERRGHTIKCCQANGGGYQAIMRDFETGAWIAATEMRKDGNADGY